MSPFDLFSGVELRNPAALLLFGLVPLVLALAFRRLQRLSGRRRVVVLGLRALLLGALVATLAEPFHRVPDERAAVVLVLDVSDSVGGTVAARERLEDAWNRLQPRDRLAAVAFGQGAAVWLPWTAKGDRPFAEVLSSQATGQLPPSDQSDLAAGLRLASSLASGQPAARLVLVTDGWVEAARVPSGRGVAETLGRELVTVPVSASAPTPETILTALEAPILTRIDEPFVTTVLVSTTSAQPATLHTFVDGQPADDVPVTLTAGLNRIPLDQKAGSAGTRRVAVAIEAGADTLPTNNRAEAVLVVKERGRVLVLEERRGEGEALDRALRAGGLDVDTQVANRLGDLPALAGYDAIVLANVAATTFTLDQQKTLQAFVANRGGGLVVAGGRTTFALGGYANTPVEAALPLTAEVPPRTEASSFALLLILDRSGSMEVAVDGVKKIRMASEAGILATESLRSGDYVGVLSFDTKNFWTVPVQRVDDEGGLPAVQRRIAGLTSGGGTHIYPALKEGFEAIRNVPADSRHIILMSDGISWGDGDFDALLAEIRASRVIVSTIALGGDADKRLMSRLAQLGEGRYYFTERVRDLPRLITRETTIARESPIVEGTIQPVVSASSPILRQLVPSELPDLKGYIAATARPEAEVVLTTDRGDPLLAQWHYGLGRAVAWTGGTTPEWSGAWLDWPQYADFWSQTVRWAMPAPGNRDFEASVTREGDRATIRVDALQPGGGFTDNADVRATVLTPDNRRHELRLRQTAPGRYETSASVGGQGAPAGAYRVEVTQFNGNDRVRSEATGFTVPSDPEQLHLGSNESLLRRLTSEAGGRVVDELSGALDRAGLPPGQQEIPLWPWPLGLAILLLPLDVAARRLF